MAADSGQQAAGEARRGQVPEGATRHVSCQNIESNGKKVVANIVNAD